MRQPLILRVLALSFSLTGLVGWAEPVVVEGTAAIRNNDLPAAREEAIRNALAEVSRQGSLNVRAALGTAESRLAFDDVVVRSSATVHRHQVLKESHEGGIYRVTLSADVDSKGEGSESSVCKDGHLKRIVIGGFPVLHPEHLLDDELDGYAHLTASELARRFGGKPALLVDQEGSLMTHFSLPERVRGDLPRAAQALQIVRAAAEKHRAQYVLVGYYHSLALGPRHKEREIDLEALVIDAFSGACVARQRFTRKAAGQVVLPRSMLFGSPAHYRTDLGRTWGELLSEIARWAETRTSCLPFSARVIKVVGKAVYFDAGAEQRVAVGDSFSSFRAKTEPVVTSSGEVLGYERTPVGQLRVTAVYPRFAIGQLDAPALGTVLKPGDELYAR